jgi:hypothetical protein
MFLEARFSDPLVGVGCFPRAESLLRAQKPDTPTIRAIAT